VNLAARADALSVTRRAVFAVVLAVVGWSASSLFVRAGHSDALVFTTWRLWFALPPLAVAVALRRRAEQRPMLWPADASRVRWVVLMFGAGAFFVSGAATTFAAFGLTRLLDVTLIGSLQPLLIIAFAIAFLGERLLRGLLTRAVVAVIGTIVVALAASGSGSWSLAGDILAVGGLVLNAGWFLYGRVLRTNFEIDPFAFMFGTLTAGAILLTPLTLIVHHTLAISGRGMLFAFCTMISGTTGHVLMVWAHRYVPTSVSSPLLLAETPMVAAGAWVFFGESLGVVEAAGSAVVVASLWGVVRSAELAHAEDPAPDPAPPT
jgi:drug/metabolite transporter (DMT)-like permease